MNLLNREIDSNKDLTGRLVTEISDKMRSMHKGPQAGQAIVALESLNDAGRSAIEETGEFIGSQLAIIRNQIGMEGELLESQKYAAAQAGILASNWQGFNRLKPRDGLPRGVAMTEVVTMESMNLPDVVSERSYATESYDNTDNRTAVAYSITYNLQSSRQDDFGEALFPTITIPADQAGIVITTNLLCVLDNVDRNVSGQIYDLKRKNVLRAVADPTVLRKEQTRAVPVVRAQSLAQFVAAGTMAARTVDIDGETITTSALLFGKTIDLLGISQSDSLVASGVQNQTDSLDPTVELQTIYVSIDGDVFGFKVQNPGGNFVPNAQGDFKLLTLNFETTSLLFNNLTNTVAGTAPTGDMLAMRTANYVIRIRAVLNGSVRTDTGNIQVYGNTLEIYEIKDAAGNVIALDANAGVIAAVAAVKAATWLGYDALAYRSNSNRRQQGQFVDVSKQYQRYLVPLRSPITARHPAHTEAGVDASDVSALITTTRIRISNEAVTAILQSADLLSSFIDIRDNVGEGPDVLGVGRHYVRASYIARNWDATTKVDSIKSHERAADIQASLINEVRDITYLLYRDSEFKAASDQLYAGSGPIPKVIIATDPYTARYLSVSGDLRTLGGEFDFQVVSTLDVRFRGKIMIAFGMFDGDRNTTINPLNNGNLLWAPELVLTANISRGGQYSRETLVQPRYRFIQNLPVLGLINVSNIPNVLNKLPLFMKTIP